MVSHRNEWEVASNEWEVASGGGVHSGPHLTLTDNTGILLGADGRLSLTYFGIDIFGTTSASTGVVDKPVRDGPAGTRCRDPTG